MRRNSKQTLTPLQIHGCMYRMRAFLEPCNHGDNERDRGSVLRTRSCKEKDGASTWCVLGRIQTSQSRLRGSDAATI
jgi:hypothetical protein